MEIIKNRSNFVEVFEKIDYNVAQLTYNKKEREEIIMTLKEQQMRFDYEKWMASVAAGEDKCGTYPFCDSCTKTVTYPCARAARKASAVRVATVRKRK